MVPISKDRRADIGTFISGGTENSGDTERRTEILKYNQESIAVIAPNTSAATKAQKREAQKEELCLHPSPQTITRSKTLLFTLMASSQQHSSVFLTLNQNVILAD